MKQRLYDPRKGSAKTSPNTSWLFLLALIGETPLLTTVNVHWENENTYVCGGLLDTGSTITLNPEDPESYHGPLVRLVR